MVYLGFSKNYLNVLSHLSIFMPLIFEIQLINGALFLKTNFFSPNALLFIVLVTLALFTVLLGASKSAAVNIFLATNISFHNNIRITKIT